MGTGRVRSSELGAGKVQCASLSLLWGRGGFWSWGPVEAAGTVWMGEADRVRRLGGKIDLDNWLTGS